MASLLPLATYNTVIKPFTPTNAYNGSRPVTIRLTLAAIDPEAVDEKADPSTLRLLKRNVYEDSEDEGDEDYSDSDDWDTFKDDLNNNDILIGRITDVEEL